MYWTVDIVAVRRSFDDTHFSSFSLANHFLTFLNLFDKRSDAQTSSDMSPLNRSVERAHGCLAAGRAGRQRRQEDRYHGRSASSTYKNRLRYSRGRAFDRLLEGPYTLQIHDLDS